MGPHPHDFSTLGTRLLPLLHLDFVVIAFLWILEMLPILRSQQGLWQDRWIAGANCGSDREATIAENQLPRSAFQPAPAHIR